MTALKEGQKIRYQQVRERELATNLAPGTDVRVTVD